MQTQNWPKNPQSFAEFYQIMTVFCHEDSMPAISDDKLVHESPSKVPDIS
jgi:hypothetical protein